MTRRHLLREVVAEGARATRLFVGDVGNGMLVISHNVLALVGLAVLAVVLFASGRADLRATVETKALSWLQAREEARAELRGELNFADEALDPADRVTAADPAELAREQAAVAGWISRRYRVAMEPVSRLVQEAWHVGRRAGVEPTLILAVMAVESRFNPFAQSQAGAQGLMQVMTRVHNDKYEPFGGRLAAFDPVTNLRVGVMVLRECIARAGSLEEGLRYYVGAASLMHDGGYASKVLGEHALLKQVAAGQSVPIGTVVPVTLAHRTPPQAAGDAASAPESNEPLPEPAPAEDTAVADKVALLGAASLRTAASAP